MNIKAYNGRMKTNLQDHSLKSHRLLSTARGQRRDTRAEQNAYDVAMHYVKTLFVHRK